MLTAFSALASPPTITVQPQKRTVVEGTNYTFTVSAAGTDPLLYQWRRDGADLGGQTNASLPLTNIQTNQAGLYAVVITNIEGAVTSAPARLTVRSASDPVYPAPQGGWAYLFQGDGVSNSLTAGLDGTWNRQNGDDSWDGFGRGAGEGLPGGVSTTNGILTVEDTINSGSGTADNRRYYFTHDLAQEAFVTNGATVLNDGVTLTFRARLTPPSDPLIELSDAPNGWVNVNDGKGLFGIRQSGSSGLLISFSLNKAVEDTSASGTFNFGQAGLHMNNLNGNVRSSFVDPGEGGTLNLLPLDPAVFHEFWITIQDNGAAPGTHAVSIYLDGSKTPTVFNVTAGSGSEGTLFTNYLALGMPSTGQRGAVDIDFFGYAPGVIAPTLFNEPLGFTLLPTNQILAAGQVAAFNVGVTGTPPYSFQWYRNGDVIADVTNASYTTPPITQADDGAQFYVVVTNQVNVITSAPPAVLTILHPPGITAQPQSLVVSNGDTANFSVTATSPAAISYQWRFNGAPLASESNSTLVIPNAAPANAGNYTIIVSNNAGAVTSTVATLTVRILDYGDAPDPGYPTFKASNGARHVIVPGIFLGQTVDSELDGLPNATATGDDINGDNDDDGVTFTSPLRAGQLATVEVVASTNGFLDAWIDFNADGSWAGAGEQIFTNRALVAGTNVLTFLVSPGAAGGNTFARFRFSTAGGLSFNGPAADGEVEDYMVNVVPVADLVAAIDDSPDPVAVSSNLTYSILVSNAGPSTATAVNLTNTLASGVTFVSASGTQGSCSRNGEIVSCSLGALASATSAIVTIVVVPPATGNLTNSAVASATELDLNPANNGALANTTVFTAPTIAAQPQNVTVTNGSSATFFVSASGTAPLLYQWRFNGGDLSGETNATLTIPSAQPGSAGSYSVRVTNQVGAVNSATATLTVLVPPAITAQPQSRTNFAGSTATFSVTATGTAPLLYQWSLNDTNALAAATNATLLLTNVQPTEVGNYRVTVSNIAGVVTSAVASLTILQVDFGDAPDPGYPTLLANNGARHLIVPGIRLGARVDFEPDGQPNAAATGDDLNGPNDEDGVTFTTPLRVGQMATLSVVASTNGLLNAWIDFSRNNSWADAGEQVFTNVALASGTNLLTLLVPPSASTGVSYARFRFSTVGGLSFDGQAADGEVEDYAVSINPAVDLAASLTDQPDPVVVGSNISYTIIVTNAGPSAATSVLVSDLLPGRVSFVSASSSVGGCTNASGTINCSLGSLGAQAGLMVTIIVTATGDGLITNAVQVTSVETDIAPSNNIASTTTASFIFPSIVTPPHNTTVTNGDTATFTVTAAGTAPRYQWRRNGTDLFGATNATLAIVSAQSADAGAYTVRVTNEVGAVESAPATLTVLVPATITVQPQNTTVVAGSQANFGVTATGTAPLSYQWQFGGIDLPGETNAALVIPNTQPPQAGTYRVRVANDVRSVLSDPAVLTVLVPPAITSTPRSRTNFAGSDAAFAVAATGTTPLHYQWYFNQTNELPAQTNTTLLLTNVQRTQSGDYSVIITNSGGVATSVVAVLTVFEVDFGDAPESAGYPTTLIFNGARHRIVPGVYLGSGVDFEPDGQPNALATGDDLGGFDDEDGITFTSLLRLGQMATLSVVASTNGFLDAWIDFDGNGSWADGGEQIFVSRALTPGVNLLSFTVPSSAATTNTFARFRFSTAGGLSFDGWADDGEVEDYGVTIVPAFDLGLSISDAPAPVLTTSNLTYSITVTNRGPSTALGVTLTNFLPEAVAFLAATASQGSCTQSNGVVRCNLGSLAAANSAIVTVVVRTGGAGTIIDSAQVGAAGVEVNPADNVATRTTAVVVPPSPFGNPDFIPIADATVSDPGQSTPYPSTILVSGLTGTVQKVTVTLSNMTHAFPDDLDVLLVGPGGQAVLLMSDAGGAVAMTEVTATFDDASEVELPNSGAISSQAYRPSNYGSEADFFPAPAPVGPYASALAAFQGTDPNGTWSLYIVDDAPGDVGSISGWNLEITTVDPIADVAVALAATPNPVAVISNLTYTIIVTNRGPAAATGVALGDVLPAGVNFVSASFSGGSCSNSSGTVTCVISNLNPATAAVATLVVQPTATGSISNFVSVTARQIDFTSANNSASLVTSVGPVTDLSLAAFASTNLVILGQDLVYAMRVTNRGPISATSARLTDVLPAGVNFISATASIGGCTNDGGVVTCDLGNLDVGQGAELMVTVHPLSIGILTNTVSVSELEFDSAPADNNAVIVTPVNVVADLEVTMADAPDPVAVSSNLTYAITVTNLGPSSAHGVVAQLPLGGTMGFVSATSSQGDCTNAGGLVICALGVLANGEGAVVQVIVAPTMTGLLTNSVTVIADSVDFVSSNNFAETVTLVLQPPIIITPPQSQAVFMGSNVTFTVLASGFDGLQYQWQFNGSDLPGATNTSLMLANVSTADAGIYRVRVSNPVGVALSAPAILRLLSLPMILDFPTSAVTIDEDTPTPLLNFSIGDFDSDASSLVVTGASSDPLLVPTANIVFGGSGSNRTVQVTPALNKFGNAVITVTVRDSDDLTAQGSFSLTVRPINDPPAISSTTNQSTPEDTAIAVNVTVSDIETSANDLTLAGSSSNTNLVPAANVAVSGSGAQRAVTITPATNEFGSTVITLTASDGTNQVSNSFVLTVLPVNDPPTLDPISDRIVTEDSGPQSVTLSGLSFGPTNEAQTLTISAVSSNPSLVPNPIVSYTSPDSTGTLTFASATNANGSATITVTVNDGGLSNNIVSRMFTVPVTPVNDPPTLSHVADITISEDTPANAAFAVSDVESPPETLAMSASSSNTNLVPNANIILGGLHAVRTVNLLPVTNRFGTTTITITVTDTNGASSSDSFVLTVLPVADPPTISSITNQTIDEDTTAGPLSFTVDGPDSNPASLVFSGRASNTNLLPTANIVFGGSGANRTVTVAPATNQFGSATVTITATDTNRLSVSASFLLTVNPINDPPTLAPIANVTVSKNSGTRTVPLSGIGAGGTNELQTLLLTATSSDPSIIPNPALTYFDPQTTGTLSFVTMPGVIGTATITVTVDDGQSTNHSVSRSFTVTVTGANDPPTISDITDRSIDEDTSTVISFTVNDDSTPAGSLILTRNSSNTNLLPNANVVLTGSGNNRTLSLKPATNQFGAATVTVTVTDTNGASASDSFLVTVNPVNDSPVISDIADQTVNEDTNGLVAAFTIGDVETPAQNLILSARSSNPTLVPNANVVFGGSGSNRTATVTPLLNQSGSATITITVHDEGGLAASDSFLLAVNAVNDRPTISSLPDTAIDEDTVLAMAFAVGDAETPAVSLTVIGSSSDVNLVPNANIVFSGSGASRVVTVTPATNQSGVVTITLVVADGSGGSTTNQFRLTVNAVNDPPTLAALNNLSLPKNAGLQTVNLNGIGSGAANEIQTLTVTASSSNPNLVPTPAVSYTSPSTNGSLAFTPNAGASGACIISVTVNDGGASNNITTRSFAVTISGTNMPPTISDIVNQTINEDTVMTVPFVVSDVETAPFNLALSAASTNTTLVPNASIFFDGNGTNRLLRVVPVTNQFGTTLITVTVNDGAATASDSFVLTVNPVNDLPTLDPLSDLAFTGNPGVQSVPLTGISSGASNENQTLTVAVSTDNPGLFFSQPSVSYTSPNATGTLNFRPSQHGAGTAVVTVTVQDGGASNNIVSRSFTLFQRSSGSSPTISTPAGQTINEDASTGPIAFTVADPDTALTALTVTASSSNTNVVPNANVVLGGSGGSRTVTVTPSPNQSGTTTITLSVTDGNFGLARSSFVVTVNAVNDLPTLSAIADQVINEDTATSVIPFTVSDVETPAANLVLTATSTNTALAPVSNIVFGGSGTNRALRVTPAADQFGTTLITVTVTDGNGGSTNRSFLLTVNSVDDPPGISSIADQTINEDQATPALPFTIGDDQTPIGSLTLIVASSNPSLVPTGDVAIGGSGSNRTVTVTPLANQFGMSVITLTVVDGGGLRASNSFLLSVNAVNDPATLDALTNLTVIQGTGSVVVNLTGIGSGAPNENQTLAVTATSSNPALIPDPVVAYTTPNATGTLTLTPIAGTNGSATITVTVSDGQSQNSPLTRSFIVTVSGVPFVSDIVDQITDENTPITISFSVNDAETAPGSLTLTASSSNTNLVAATNVVFSGGGISRSMNVTPASNGVGHASITITVRDTDGNTASTSFELIVRPVNHAPTLNPIGGLTLPENAGTQAVNLTGISAGAASENQTLTVTANSSDPRLIPAPVVNYSSPNSTGTLRFTPVAHSNGVAAITVVVSDGQSQNGSVTQVFTVTIQGTNDPPVLLHIPDQVTDEDTPIIVGFTATDVENFNGGVSMLVSSSNPALVAPSNVSFGGGFGNFSMLIRPTPNQSGATTITLTLIDGEGARASDSFVLTVNPVNDPPVISHVANQVTSEDTPVTASLIVGDLETPAANLTLSATSSNPVLAPPAGITFGGGGSNRTVTVMPTANRSGSAVITVTVSDGNGGTASDSFVLTVNPVEDPPVISDIANQVTYENLPTSAIPFIVSDAETPAANLYVNATSSDPALVPAANIVIGGSGTNRTLIVVPAGNRFGTATITVTVTDGSGGTASDTFVLTVNEASGPPAILNDPAAQTVASGVTVSFSVTAIGTAPLSYQWQRNGVNLAGQTNATLVLVGVQGTDAGNYSVRVSNSAGSVTSAAAALRVLMRPVIVAISRSGSVSGISFTTEVGVSYTVEFRDAAGVGAWNALAPVMGTGAVMTLNDPAEVAPRRFYRVRAD